MAIAECQIKLFDTCAEYNKCRLYSEMLTDKPLTNSAAQEEKHITKQAEIKSHNKK
jgi:hypothetical protein